VNQLWRSRDIICDASEQSSGSEITREFGCRGKNIKTRYKNLKIFNTSEFYCGQEIRERYSSLTGINPRKIL
jgi:hypothetical protein